MPLSSKFLTESTGKKLWDKVQ